MKKVVVLGSNSFSGSDFVDLLLEKEEYNVLGISRSAEKSELFLPYLKRKSKNFSFKQLDLNNDVEEIINTINLFEPEYIVNFAAQSEVAPSWENPHHWFQTNTVALSKLLNPLKEKKYLKRYVHISSPEVYGSCTGRVLESAPLNPSTPYAASKAAADLFLFTLVKNFNFPASFIRATNVYGAHQQLFKIIPRSAINILLGNTIQLHGGGKAVKSYIHIRDISCGELEVMLNGRLGQIYNFSPDAGISVYDVVSKICNLMNVSVDKATEAIEERLGQDAAYVIDSSLARSEFNWKPKIDIESGLEEVVTWVKENIEAIKEEPLSYTHKA